MKEIYLDNAATTKVRKEVLKEMLKYFDKSYGNPGSFHNKGLEAKNALDSAREKVAKILNCKLNEIVFCSGGTESINLALKGLVKNSKKKHIITTKVEHHAVLDSCKYLEEYEGCKITYLGVDKYGMVDVKKLEKAIRKDTFLISIMYANNEIGTINPVKEISKIARKHKIVFHTDACQAAGYCDVDVKRLGIDLMTINSSKLCGPKGVGLLYVKEGINLTPLIHGGGQENKLRSGTENIPGVVGFSLALELVQKEKNKEVKRLVKLRDYFIKGVLDNVSKSFLNGHPSKRLPNNVNVSILDVEGEAMVLYLNEYKIYASTGSACTSQTLDPSHVVIAMGLPHEAAHGSLRFSLGRETKKKDVDKVLKVLPKIIKKLRDISPVSFGVKK